MAEEDDLSRSRVRHRAIDLTSQGITALMAMAALVVSIFSQVSQADLSKEQIETARQQAYISEREAIPTVAWWLNYPNEGSVELIVQNREDIEPFPS